MSSPAESLSLNGRVAVVTGAARGIGAATATALARAGADLVLCDRDGDGLEETRLHVRNAGRMAVLGTLDVRDREAVEGFVAEAALQLGAIDVLVNNAAGTFHAPFLDVDAKGEAALVAENFSSVTDWIRCVVPHMRTQGGAIVNVTSVEAHRAAPGYAVYAAMKAAVANLTRSLALELADRRIRVNCVAPDAIPTPGTGGQAPPTPWPEPGRPEDVAGAVLFLASDLARFVTGTTLHVDGGTSAAAGWRRRANGGYEL